MKLRVNLYVQALQPVKEKISLNLLVGSTLGLSVVLLVTGLLINLQAEAKQTQVVVLQQQVKTQAEQISQLQKLINERKPSELLVKQHTELTQTIVQKQKLLQFVQGEQVKTSVKYSPVFQYLAGIDPEGFWLESFSLNASSSEFSGYVTKAELLPLWLTHLSATEFFKGHTFSRFEINQTDKSEALAFKVQSSATDTVSTEAKP